MMKWLWFISRSFTSQSAKRTPKCSSTARWWPRNSSTQQETSPLTETKSWAGWFAPEPTRRTLHRWIKHTHTHTFISANTQPLKVPCFCQIISVKKREVNKFGFHCWVTSPTFNPPPPPSDLKERGLQSLTKFQVPLSRWLACRLHSCYQRSIWLASSHW